METSSADSQQPRAGVGRRFFRWLFRWRIVRRLLIAFAALITLAALFATEENWRGKRAWENYRRELEAKGEKLDMASLAPTAVPAEQNFVATPFLAPLLEYQDVNGELRWADSNGVARIKNVSVGDITMGNWLKGERCDLAAVQKAFGSNTNLSAPPQPGDPARDILFALQKYDPVIQELRSASRRPYAVCSANRDVNIAAMLEQAQAFKALVRLAVLRASANLAAGTNSEALADTKLAFHLSQSFRSAPILISQMVRIAILNLSLQPVWEGLADHRWTDAGLRELQEMLAGARLLEDYGLTMRGERAFGNEMMNQYIAGRFPTAAGGMEQNPALLRLLMPRGLFYQNMVVMNRLHEEFTFPAVDAAAHRVYPEKCDTNLIAAALGSHTPYNMFAWLNFPAFNRVVLLFARAQTGIDEAIIGCALERHRLAHGSYPATLDALVPQFIAKIPNDVIDGQPLHYKVTDDGSFVLYSIGWNQKDDGGNVSLKKAGALDPDNGDWVWRYPSR